VILGVCSTAFTTLVLMKCLHIICCPSRPREEHHKKQKKKKYPCVTGAASYCPRDSNANRRRNRVP
jgi:hypothetical protein